MDQQRIIIPRINLDIWRVGSAHTVVVYFPSEREYSQRMSIKPLLSPKNSENSDTSTRHHGGMQVPRDGHTR